MCPEVRDAGTSQGLTQGDGPGPVPLRRTQLEKMLQKQHTTPAKALLCGQPRKRNNRKLMLPENHQKQQNTALTQDEGALEEKAIFPGPSLTFSPQLATPAGWRHRPLPPAPTRLPLKSQEARETRENQCSGHLHRLHGDITAVTTLLHYPSPALSVYTYVYLYAYTCGYMHTHRLSLLNHLKATYKQHPPSNFSMNFLIRAFSYSITTNTNISEL